MGFPGEDPRSAETFTCSKVALRGLAKMFPDPLFIKMDIEGMEEEVLRDVEFFRERKPTVLVELHRSGGVIAKYLAGFWSREEALSRRRSSPSEQQYLGAPFLIPT